ncbi:MFS transporter [Aristaeella lactis]|uniref:MFS/sugar transport protein n=1 Tax=Aristaeella lactis TaxID=3046383 RepID=A0AC61PPP6_9FIRM|nr:MFS transporter [Aristaeella lactis]QUA54432.1 MFS transporter [Aristaeella lactis]SMC83015.1 MFS/sugar transport protein [Aristaeella lactis]
MKLNVKRTCQIGFAFFGILLLWQVYDSWCPTFLTDLFAHRMYGLTSAELKASAPDKILNVQWLVGIIMACDNLAALILLPIFGNLSDRTKTPIGKRMPYILVGTFVAAVAFPFIPLFFHQNNMAGMIIMMGIVLIFMMMYRNPAVALMPDITPKPLRAKANGIINIMGYLGGGFATILGVFLKLSDYINVTDRSSKMWIIEIPFIVASVLMVISALVLFFTVKENKIEEEMKDELAEGERLAAIENPATDEGPMSPANRRMLLAILGAEFLWFMSDNAIGTYIGNYVIYYLNAASSATMILTLGGGLAAAIGFLIAGGIAEKVGRKWTVSSGLIISFLATMIMIFVRPTGKVVGEHGEFSFPAILFGVWALKGFGMALVHNCSFPMVVELCTSKKIGKFTGYYYAASMSAQTVTPVLLGLIFMRTGAWGALPVYSTILTVCSALVFILLVKNIKTRKVANASGLEAFAEED